jgi:putative endonuclease
MWYVYILYSISAGKSYVGYSNDVTRRVFEHNVSEQKGYTLRYRPWTVIQVEEFGQKLNAIDREKFLKTGRGREEVKAIIQAFIEKGGAVSAAAEKD